MQEIAMLYGLLPDVINGILFLLHLVLFLAALRAEQPNLKIANFEIPDLFKKKRPLLTILLFVSLLVVWFPWKLLPKKSEIQTVKVISLLSDQTDRLVEQVAQEHNVKVDFVDRIAMGGTNLREVLESVKRGDHSADVVLGASCQTYLAHDIDEQYLEKIPNELAAEVSHEVEPEAISDRWIGWYKGYLALAYSPTRFQLAGAPAWPDLLDRLHQEHARVMAPTCSRHAAGTVLAVGLYDELQAKIQDTKRTEAEFERLLTQLANDTVCFRTIGHPDVNYIASGRIDASIDWAHDIFHQIKSLGAKNVQVYVPPGTPWEVGVVGIVSGHDSPAVRKLITLLVSQTVGEEHAKQSGRYPVLTSDLSLPASLKRWQDVGVSPALPCQDRADIVRAHKLAEQYMDLPDSKECSRVFAGP